MFLSRCGVTPVVPGGVVAEVAIDPVPGEVQLSLGHPPGSPGCHLSRGGHLVLVKYETHLCTPTCNPSSGNFSRPLRGTCHREPARCPRAESWDWKWSRLYHSLPELTSSCPDCNSGGAMLRRTWDWSANTGQSAQPPSSIDCPSTRHRRHPGASPQSPLYYHHS